MEAYKTEHINDDGNIDEISIKTELERQDYITKNQYIHIKNINDFKEESKYVKAQERLSLDRNLTEDLHRLFKKCRYGHIFKQKDWKPERWCIERFNRINNNIKRC